MTQVPSYRLAVDIGGTFTDVVLSADDRILTTTKVLTTHDDPSQGAFEGTAAVLSQAAVELSAVSGFIHGTTLATNALLERRGAQVSTITTEGFRDILEIAYERRYQQYDIELEKTDLLVPRARRFTIDQRMTADGSVLRDLDESQVADLARALRAVGTTSIAICLLHSYANPDHERRLKRALAVHFPHMPISISSEISPEAREFERCCTTVANAYVQPLMARYLERFATRFADGGLRCPILMMTAGGGMTTLEAAKIHPIRLVESGPAGGAILAANLARTLDLTSVLSFDMGGTTAKLCLIDDFQPQTARLFEISRAERFIKGSGMPVRIPVIDMIEIGAGGGSIAHVDRLGRILVGPQSAGSEPGPAAFGAGGSQATVTDSDVVLGLISPALFAEGKLTINRPAAVDSVDRNIGVRLNLEPIQAAEGISQIVDENMASAARMHAVESGKDLGARAMIAFGGNGPLHATRVARRAGVTTIIIPPSPGVGSAIGFLCAPVSFEIVRSHYSLLDALDVDGVNQLIAGLIEKATAVVEAGAPGAVKRITRAAYVRYMGQGHEIEIALPDRPLNAADRAHLRHLFEHEYAHQFSRAVPAMEIEILNWSVSVSSPASAVAGPAAEPADGAAAEEELQIFCDHSGEMRTARALPRRLLKVGQRIVGPALITEAQTTTYVSADFDAQKLSDGSLRLTRLPAAGDQP